MSYKKALKHAKKVEEAIEEQPPPYPGQGTISVISI
jgi:hypothetical protein